MTVVRNGEKMNRALLYTMAFATVIVGHDASATTDQDVVIYDRVDVARGTTIELNDRTLFLSGEGAQLYNHGTITGAGGAAIVVQDGGKIYNAIHMLRNSANVDINPNWTSGTTGTVYMPVGNGIIDYIAIKNAAGLPVSPEYTFGNMLDIGYGETSTLGTALGNSGTTLALCTVTANDPRPSEDIKFYDDMDIANTSYVFAKIGNVPKNLTQAAHGLLIKKTAGSGSISLCGDLSNFSDPAQKLTSAGTNTHVSFTGENSFPPSNVIVTDGAKAELEMDITIDVGRSLTIEADSRLSLVQAKKITINGGYLKFNANGGGAIRGNIVLKNGAKLIIGDLLPPEAESVPPPESVSPESVPPPEESSESPPPESEESPLPESEPEEQDGPDLG
jgi:hypothetical protein